MSQTNVAFHYVSPITYLNSIYLQNFSILEPSTAATSRFCKGPTIPRWCPIWSTTPSLRFVNFFFITCFRFSKLNCFFLLGNWPNNAPPGHYNRQYPPQGTPPQQWGGQRPPGPPVMGPQGQAQWAEQHRYPPQGPQPPFPGNQQVTKIK